MCTVYNLYIWNTACNMQLQLLSITLACKFVYTKAFYETTAVIMYWSCELWLYVLPVIWS